MNNINMNNINMNYASCNVYKFERMRLGHKTQTSSGAKYGPYLYRNIKNNELMSSWDKPIKEPFFLYKGEDIGYNADALIYYKNY